jgi:hypothetical protein
VLVEDGRFGWGGVGGKRMWRWMWIGDGERGMGMDGACGGNDGISGEGGEEDERVGTNVYMQAALQARG